MHRCNNAGHTGGLYVKTVVGTIANLAPILTYHTCPPFLVGFVFSQPPGNAYLGARHAQNTVFTSDEEIASIAQRVLDLTLPKSEWTHAAHFALTCWIVSMRPDIDAAREMPALIRAYNVATGVANTANSGYHETITQASIRAAREFLGRDPSLSLTAACNALMTSRLGRPDWLLAYWKSETLFSSGARACWREPDIEHLPF